MLVSFYSPDYQGQVYVNPLNVQFIYQLGAQKTFIVLGSSATITVNLASAEVAERLEVGLKART